MRLRESVNSSDLSRSCIQVLGLLSLLFERVCNLAMDTSYAHGRYSLGRALALVAFYTWFNTVREDLLGLDFCWVS